MSELITRRELMRLGIACSVSGAFGIEAPFTRAFAASNPVEPPLQAALAPRERVLLDFDWKFTFGHLTDPLRDLGFGKDQGDFAKTGNFKFATEKFDDSGWRALQLPHDWAVELPFVRDEALQSHGYKPLGRQYPENSVGWYRRSFELPASDAKRRIFLDFDGAFRSALVFLNGCFIGRNDHGYTPFRFDLTDFVNFGGKNVLAVRVDASLGDGWFYEGAGIYRHVWLTKTEPLHLSQWESHVRTELKGDHCELTLLAQVENLSPAEARAGVHWKIFDPHGRLVAETSAPGQSIAVDASVAFKAVSVLKTPELWSPNTPNLYTAEVAVSDGDRVRDAERFSFGVRSLRFDPDKGFFLNGHSLLIKGTCNHQDHAGVGAALPDHLQWYRLGLLRQMGSNAVRTSHNMPSPEWVEACDRTGMMMMCEARQLSSSAEGLAQLELMIKRYRNSPAVILWSVGNEEFYLQGREMGEHIVATLVRRAHELDPTRLCTAAVNADFEGGISKPLDVEGINYNLGVIDEYHRRHPRQPMLGSETASTVSTRGIYSTDSLRNWVSAYDLNHTKWSELAEEWWKFYAARPYLPGGFAWTGFDYRGEPTPYGWPSINSQFGILDTCGFPKDNYYYYQAWWGERPVLHLFPHWNWEQRIGESIAVWVHSNLDEVELFLNGESLGSQPVQPLTHLAWDVKYRPGVLEARGRKQGKVVLVTRRETTGSAASIRLSAEREDIRADGQDIAVVTVEVLDEAGRAVPTADNLIQFRISGEGTFLGVGNGDPNCQESDVEPRRSLFNGLAQLLVRSTRKAGPIAIEAYTEEWPGPKLPVARLIVQSRQV